MQPSATPLSFLPTPSALLTTRSSVGERVIYPVGWLGVVCDTPPLLSVCFGPGSGGESLPGPGDSFAVNLPDEEVLQLLSAGGLSGSGIRRRSARISLSFIEGSGEEMLLMPDCPVAMECRCRSLLTRFGQHRLCGEILAVYLDGVRHELTAPFNLCRLAPFQRLRSQRRARYSWGPLDSQEESAG